jgi:hypothetical protein
MNDESLVALAAKAFGVPPDEFSPLTDDGDNRRLQVACRINLLIYENSPPELGLPRACAVAVNPSGEWFAEAFRPDESAAARLAVIRAAAAIGKDMP